MYERKQSPYNLKSCMNNNGIVAIVAFMSAVSRWPLQCVSSSHDFTH